WLAGYKTAQVVLENRQQRGPFLAGDAGDARGDDHVGKIPKLGIRRQRLSGEGVEGGAGDPACFESTDKQRFIDGAAAGEIDQICAGFHSSQLVFTDYVELRGHGSEQQDDVVGLRKQVRQKLRRAQLADVLRLLDGGSFGGEHAHAERVGFARELGADRAEADDAEGAAFDLARLELLPFFFALRFHAVGELFCEGQDAGEGEFRKGR